MLQHITTRIRAFALNKLWRNEEGSIAMFVGIGLLTLVAATGSAIDMSRLQTVRAKLSSSLDAAGLAAGAKVNSSDVNEVVRNYMDVNFPEGFLDSKVTNISVTVNPDNTVINLAATASVKMSFMQVFGIESMEVMADSEITRENRGLELVMVLDNTGSMYSSGKIEALRSAAGDMVDILFGEKETIENLWVAVVPYVTTVNVGPDKISWLRNYNVSLYPPLYPNSATKWKGCVEARGQYPAHELDPEGIPYDLSEDPPFTGDKATATPAQLATTFPMWFWADSADNNWYNNNNGRVTLNESPGYSNSGVGPNISCGDEVLPFRSSKSVLSAKVRGLHANNRSGTMSSLGLTWGWHMISPKWRGYWNQADPKLPLDYHTPLMNKAVILMTDGINEVVGDDYNGYRYIADEHLGPGVNTPAEGVTAVNQRTAALCTAMKAKGILIYTVTFQLGNSTAHNNARTLFRNCATHPDYFFDSPDAATLRKSFRQIGDSLANLMISH